MLQVVVKLLYHWKPTNNLTSYILKTTQHPQPGHTIPCHHHHSTTPPTQQHTSLTVWVEQHHLQTINHIPSTPSLCLSSSVSKCEFNCPIWLLWKACARGQRYKQSFIHRFRFTHTHTCFYISGQIICSSRMVLIRCCGSYSPSTKTFKTTDTDTYTRSVLRMLIPVSSSCMYCAGIYTLTWSSQHAVQLGFK